MIRQLLVTECHRELEGWRVKTPAGADSFIIVPAVRLFLGVRGPFKDSLDQSRSALQGQRRQQKPLPTR